MKLKSLAVLSLAGLTFAQSYAATNIPAKIIEEDIIKFQLQTDQLLRQKAHILLKETTGELSGMLTGTIDGSSQNQSRVGSVIGKTLIGALAGTGIALTGLAAPLGLATLLAQAGTVAGIGATAGALTPENIQTGSLKGSIEGNIKGSNWDNYYQSKLYSITVIDPDQLKVLQQISENKSSKSECLSQYENNLNEIIKSKRYFTLSESKTLINNIAQINSLTGDLQTKIPGLKTDEKAYANSLLDKSTEWLKKKMTITFLGMNGLEVEKGKSYIVNTNMTFRPYKNNRSGYLFAKEENIPLLKVPFADSKTVNMSVREKLLELEQQGYVEFTTDLGKIIHPGYLHLINGVLADDHYWGGSPIYLHLNFQLIKEHTIVKNNNKCTKVSELKNYLINASSSQDLLFDMVDNNLATDLFSSENINQLKIL
jgi:hypothetical protein